MATVSGFRPPQFSESQTWLPVWLQQCDFGQLDVGGIAKDCITFDQRIEELKALQKGMSNGESLRDEDRCNIGQLFISGTESTPFSFARSADDVVQVHLCLSSDGNSDNTILSTDATESSCSLASRALDCSPNPVKDANLKYQNSGTVDWSPTVGLEKSSQENEFLRHNKSSSLCEDAADAVELCIAASEALVIKEAIENDIFAKPSASAILEASLQVKQARLALLTNVPCGTINEFSGMDSLSDIEDNLSDSDSLAMGSAYDDVGIQFNEFPENKLSVSRVNDTFDSEHGENLNQRVIDASIMAAGKSCDFNNMQVMRGNIDTEIQSRKNVCGECFDGDTRKKAISNSKGYSDTDVGYNNDCLKTVGKQCLSFSATAKAKNRLHEANVSSSLEMDHQAMENNNIVKNVVQERFQSRWLGGWNTKDEKKNFNITPSIPKPFVGETSFLSESARTAPDENSIMQNLDKDTAIASQVSIPSETLSIGKKGGMLLSQDVSSSSTSLVDPFCSVVPCSISKEARSSPPMNHEDAVCPQLLNAPVERKDNELQETAPLNCSVAEGATIVLPITSIVEPRDKVSRTLSSLKNYSKLFPRHTMDFKKNGLCKKSVFMHKYTGVTFLRTASVDSEGIAKDVPEVPILERVNSCNQSQLGKGRIGHRFRFLDCSVSNLGKENANQEARPKNKVKFLTSQKTQKPHLLLHNDNCRSSIAPKHVHFMEKETSIPNKKRPHNVYTSPKAGSANIAKRPTRTSARLASRAEGMDRFQKDSLNNEKKRLIFQNMEFLLTGLSQRKEKEIEGLIRKYGGIVLSHIPPRKGKRSSKLKHWVPIVLCLKKTQSLKFLYGCAVNANVLKVNWLIDSIAAGFVLPPKRYTILQRNTSKQDDQVHPTQYNTHALVFSNLGIMLHGKTGYFSNIGTIIEHGGGRVFKTLHRLIQAREAGRVSMGVVIVDEEICASRHLKQCASEQNVPMMSINWILKCLYAGERVPPDKKNSLQHQPSIEIRVDQDPMELSQEI